MSNVPCVRFRRMVLSGNMVPIDVRYTVYHCGQVAARSLQSCDLPSIKACEVIGRKSVLRLTAMPLPLGRFALRAMECKM